MTGQQEPRTDDRTESATDDRTESATDDRTESATDDRTESATDEQPDPVPEDDSTHLDDVEDGAGCTEIWEHLSERREAERDD